jgi:hypothetical protein
LEDAKVSTETLAMIAKEFRGFAATLDKLAREIEAINATNRIIERRLLAL